MKMGFYFPSIRIQIGQVFNRTAMLYSSSSCTGKAVIVVNTRYSINATSLQRVTYTSINSSILINENATICNSSNRFAAKTITP